MQPSYVHGYDPAEDRRLGDQARTLEALLHHDTAYPAGSRVLEAGCGVGAQTVPLLRSSPQAHFTCIDISAESLQAATARVTAANQPLPHFQQADIRALPFADAAFDHVFVCFVLEHLADPAIALAELRRVLRPGGTLTAIEGDHGSTLIHPDAPEAHRAIQCLIDLQQRAGGNANIGRTLYPLMRAAGLRSIQISPCLVYVDASHPERVQGFIHDTFTAMVAGIRDEAIRTGLTDAADFDAGIRALLRTAEPDGTFCYTFFKAVGVTECR